MYEILAMTVNNLHCTKLVMKDPEKIYIFTKSKMAFSCLKSHACKNYDFFKIIIYVFFFFIEYVQFK